VDRWLPSELGRFGIVDYLIYRMLARVPIGLCEYRRQACDIGISNGASRESAVNFFGQRHGSTSLTSLGEMKSGEVFHNAHSGKLESTLVLELRSEAN
jgi:hypothetical protein